jgi:hypothetical protein
MVRTVAREGLAVDVVVRPDRLTHGFFELFLIQLRMPAPDVDRLFLVSMRVGEAVGGRPGQFGTFGKARPKSSSSVPLRWPRQLVDGPSAPCDASPAMRVVRSTTCDRTTSAKTTSRRP